MAILVGVLAVLLVLHTFITRPPPAEGRADVIDGDSLYVGGIEVRLHGIDAVEYAQHCNRRGVAWPCGEDAAVSLRRLAQGKRVECMSTGRDLYGRRLAVCTTHDGFNLNNEQVDRGWALATSPFYVLAEQKARNGKLGIWGSDFEPPRHYRAGG